MSCAISTRAVLSPKLLTAHSPHSDPNTNTHSVIPPCSSSTPSTINTYTSSHHHHHYQHHHHHHHYQQQQQQHHHHQFQHLDTQLGDTPSDTNHSLGPPYRRSPSPSPNRLCYHRRRPLSRNPAHSPLSRYPASAPCDSDMHAHSLAYPKPSTSSLFASVPTSASASTSSSASASASANTCASASASASASAFASASVSIPSSKFISAVPTPPASSPTAAAYDPLLLRRLDALARVPSSSLPRAPSPQSPPRKHSTSGHVPLPDLPPLSPLSSLCDARSPSASTGSASASAPSDDDVAVAPIVPPMASAVPSNSAPPVIPPQPRARAPALGVAAAAARGRQFDLYMPDRRRPKNLHHPPSTRRASVDVRRPTSDLPESASLTRVSSLKTLDLPVGLVEEIPALPRPQTPSRLPRSRVFIKPSPTRSSVDAASVDCAPSGEHLFVTRDVAPRRDSHSELARPPHPPIHYSHSNWPNLVDDVPALRNPRHRHTSSVSSSGAPSSARFYFSDDDGEAPDEGDTADVDGDSAQALQKHKLPPVPNIAQLLDPHEPVSSLDILAPGSAPLPRHPPLFAHEDAISPFSANAPPSSDALSSRVRRAVSALRSISFQNANSEDCDTAWGQAPPPPSTSPPFSLRPASADVRGVPSGTPLASRWRRPRGRISSKHGVLEYESRSEHDPSSRRPSESAVPLSGRPAPPSVRARGSSQSWQKRSLWTAKRDSYEPGARAARLLVSNGPQAVLAASNDDASKSNYLDAPETAIVEPTPAPPVDKYVEFIHASATRGVKTKSSNLPSKVIHRAQAVFRRRWK